MIDDEGVGGVWELIWAYHLQNSLKCPNDCYASPYSGKVFSGVSGETEGATFFDEAPSD